jgi:type IV fimbrial biogenesis protein FimT
LIEILVVLAIIAIMLVVGVPAMGEFVADQRVRTVTSDISSDIALARAKAVESSRRVYMQKLGVNWNNGWRLYADVNDDAAYSAGIDLELKRFDGFSAGTIYLCTLPATNQIIFRPDGRVVRAGVASVNDGIYVVDTMNAGTPASAYKIRGVQFGISGRATVLKLNGLALPCVAN